MTDFSEPLGGARFQRIAAISATLVAPFSYRNPGLCPVDDQSEDSQLGT